MAVFIGHRTAELILNEPYAPELIPVPEQLLEHCDASKDAFARIDPELLKNIPAPYDVLVTSPNDLRSWKGVRCHLCQADLPFGSFLELTEGVYLASPALCLVQRAQRLSLANTVVLGARFCGTYALDSSSPTGIRRALPLTSVDELYTYVSHCQRVHGAKRARRAIALITSNAASPMETITVLVYCIPTRLYGFGLSYPTMNYERPLSQYGRQLVAKDSIRIDAYWSNFDFGLEYQGKFAHSSPTDIAADIARQLAADSMQIVLQPLTIDQLRDPAQRLYIAHMIADHIGGQVPTDPKFMVGNQRLVEDLLYPLGT